MWCFPSKGRPSACASVLAQMTARGASGPGVLVLSADDDCLPAYRDIALPPGWSTQIVENDGGGCAEKVRQFYAANPDQPWYGWMADDYEIQADGFEARLIAAAGPWGIASADDGWQAREDIEIGRMHGVSVFGGALLQVIGYWAPAGFRHCYVDNVLETIGRELGCWRTLMDVKTPHLHPAKTGGQGDAAWRSANSAEAMADDAAVFRRWAADRAESDIERARLAMWSEQGLSLDHARSRSVMLAFPVYDRPHHQHEAAAMETVGLLSRLGIRHGFCHVPGQPIHTARNLLVRSFLTTSMTDILFVDADMAWRPWDVVRLLAQRHAVIAGVGRKKFPAEMRDPGSWCFGPIGDLWEHDAAGAFEVAHVGTGFMLINRAVFAEIERRGVDRVTDADGVPYARFFSWGFADGREISEDYAFCHAWRAAGGRVVVDPSIKLTHYGTSEHRGRLADILT